MRPSRIAVITLATVLALVGAGTGYAQETRVHDHTTPAPPPPPQLTVTGFSPTRGAPGTRIIINGQGFNPRTQVLVGGRPVRVANVSFGELQFDFPAASGDNSIMVRQPGPGTDLLVGTFQVIQPINVTGFSPQSGPVGTRVEIVGTGFSRSDIVLFNDRPLAVLESNANRIVVVIPPGTRSDQFTVQRGDGSRDSTRGEFRVTWPSPVVTGMSPTSGPPGTMVRIAGDHFLTEDGVFYGNVPVPIQHRSDDALEVEVPANARTDQPFIVRGGRGESSTAPFNVILQPTLDSFKPSGGPAGTRVEIYGSEIRRGDLVVLGGRPVPILQMDERRVVVTIPPDVRDGAFSLIRNGQVLATTRGSFDVIALVAINGFAPGGGFPGTQVTLTGQGFGGDVRVAYGNRQVPIVSRNEGSLTVVVPPDASTSEPFTVSSRGTETRSGQVFQLVFGTAIESLSPTRGPWGSEVSVRGRFNGSEVFYLEAMRLPIVRRGPNEIIVQIPNDAWSGKFEYDDHGQHHVTQIHFEVQRPAEITGFSPQGAPIGVPVTVSGEFGPGASVYLRGVVCPVVSRSPGQVVVLVPKGLALGPADLVVTDGGRRLQARQPFEVLGRHD